MLTVTTINHLFLYKIKNSHRSILLIHIILYNNCAYKYLSNQSKVNIFSIEILNLLKIQNFNLFV